MAHRDILAIGTSAGGFEALRFLASEFPPDLPASVFVVIHLSSQFRSTLDANDPSGAAVSELQRGHAKHGVSKDGRGATSPPAVLRDAHRNRLLPISTILIAKVRQA